MPRDGEEDMNDDDADACLLYCVGGGTAVVQFSIRLARKRCEDSRRRWKKKKKDFNFDLTQ
jgi:hypothetical protein